MNKIDKSKLIRDLIYFKMIKLGENCMPADIENAYSDLGIMATSSEINQMMKDLGFEGE